ncbi:hypothetical protein WUBG_03893, partial [Wuchereria bancrofti]
MASKTRRLCTFCNKDSWNNEYPTFSSFKKRMERLKENNASPSCVQDNQAIAEESVHVSIPKAFITLFHTKYTDNEQPLEKIKEKTSLTKTISPIIKQWNRK